MMKLLIFLLLLVSISVNALEGVETLYEGLGLNIGPSVSYLDENTGTALNLDIALSNLIPNKYQFFTLSVNGRYLLDNDNKNGMDIEGTFILMFVIVGGGIGYYNQDDNFKRKHHFFLSLPIFSKGNLDMFWGKGSFFIEPYLRVHFFEDKEVNEYGIFLKISTHKGLSL